MMKSERAHPPGSRLVQLMASLGVLVLLGFAAGPVQAQARQNILVIWGMTSATGTRARTIGG